MSAGERGANFLLPHMDPTELLLNLRAVRLFLPLVVEGDASIHPVLQQGHSNHENLIFFCALFWCL